MDAKVQKLEHQFQREGAAVQGKISDIMSGVAVHVNGYTSKSFTELQVIFIKFVHY